MPEIALILIVIFSVILLIVIFSVVANKHKPTTRSSTKYKKLIYSDKVKKYVDNRRKDRFISDNPNYVDSNGKYIVRYDDSEKTFVGGKCYFTEDDINFVEEIVNLIFDKDEFTEEFRKSKIKFIYNCKEGQYCQFLASFLDVRYFFKNNKYIIFPFHLTSDKRSLQVLYYCQLKSIKVVEMPVTKYSEGNKNYLAYFNNDCFDEMCFLFYIMNRYPSTEGLSIHGFGSGFFNKSLLNMEHDRDFVIEYFYRMIKCRSGEFYPRADAAAETSARMIRLQGYPPPTEWVSLLAEINAEMQEKGILKSNYHNFNERQLFFLVKGSYPDAIYQYKEEWLNSLSLDIYIPSLRTAIEYQGGQHYKSVKFFGGKEKFERIKDRDLKKKQLCQLHNVRLIEWKYNLPITKSNLNNILK